MDDDAALRKAVVRLLGAHGLHAEVFASAEAFQSRFDSNDALCLILDINLGEASGIELRRQLTSAGRSMPVIFITGDDNETVRKAALESGCIAYLPKPFTGASLMDAIERARSA